jgi:RND family efflux transporter MFP subunit
MKSILSPHGVTPSRRPKAKPTLGLFLRLVTVSSFVLWACGCGSRTDTSRTGENRSIDVDTARPVTGQVVDFEEFTGRLDAKNTTDIRARVSGYIVEADFKEGDEVEKGKVLFIIDPRTYEADRNQAEANLKLAEADSRLQQKIAARSQSLERTQSVAREEYETAIATAEKAKATVGSTKAALDRAKLYVGYTKVIAPWSGRISRRMVDPGNLVNADNTVLTTLVTDDPLYAYFDVDERTYLNLVEANASKATSSSGITDSPVVFRLANESDFSRLATVNFVDNRINAATGTIRMRGVFHNETKTLKPGLFVRIRLPIGVPYKAILVRDEAVLSDQGRKYVFVVDEHNKVVYRPVTIGQETGGWRVIKEGVKLDDKIIIAGMQRVREGSLVKPTEKKPEKPSESRLVQLLTEYLSKKNGEKENGKQMDKETKKPADKDKRDGPVPAGN